MPDQAFLFNYRAGIHIALLFIFLTGAIAALLQKILKKKNGVYGAMSFLAFISAAYPGIIIFVSLVDVCAPAAATIRYYMLAIWDILATVLLVAFIILGVTLVRSAE